MRPAAGPYPNGVTAANQRFESDALQSAGKEAVEAAHLWIGIRELAGQRAQVTDAGEELGAAIEFARHNRASAHAGIARQQVGNRRDAFVGLKRTGAINDET